MIQPVATLFLLAAQALVSIQAAPTRSVDLSIKDDHLSVDSLVNVHLEHGEDVTGTWTLSAGACGGSSTKRSAIDHVIGDVTLNAGLTKRKLVWTVPSSLSTEEPACLKLVDRATGATVAESKPYDVKHHSHKRGFEEFDGMHFDASAYYKTHARRDLHEADLKDKKIGIIGAGASGLFSGYLLDSVGFHNYDILEANDRLGGRIHTHYFGSPDDYQYQEMGPMRFPIAYTHNNKTMPVNDHDIVFQLADELNKKNSKKHEIKFIKWIQQDENALVYQNGIRLPNGQVPTYGDIAKNKSLTLDVGSLSEESDEVSSKFLSDDWMNAIREDIYAAHQKALDEGLDDWSLYGYMHNKFHKSLNASDYATGGEPGQIWGTMYDQMTFMSTDWRTVDRGLNRIAEAFAPVLGKKVKFHTKVTKLEVEDNKVKVLWKTKPYDIKYKSKTYDRVIVGVPFSVVRTWHLPQMSYTISQAIRNLGYSQACKVAMQFKTRFWEHLDRPILGGCSSTDLAAGSVCYPSYKIGASGPGVMLASYNSGDMGLRLASMTEDEHVALILENMVELYGDIARDQYTGNYNRRCWQNDALQSGSWAEPSAGQHKLFMPSYFKMEQGLVFVGEHTDVKHAWISAALESAIRGVTMVLVEAGHIDEAKKIVKHWNANWLKI